MLKWIYIPKNLKIELPYDPAIQLGISQKKWNKYAKRMSVFSRVYCNTIYNSQEMKQPMCPLTDEWIKKNVVHICDGILFSHKNEWNPVICNNVHGNGKQFLKEKKRAQKEVVIHLLSMRLNNFESLLGICINSLEKCLSISYGHCLLNYIFLTDLQELFIV
jgi:hypothetical protein